MRIVVGATVLIASLAIGIPITHSQEPGQSSTQAVDTAATMTPASGRQISDVVADLGLSQDIAVGLERPAKSAAHSAEGDSLGVLGQGYDPMTQRFRRSCLNLATIHTGPLNLTSSNVLRVRYVSTSQQLRNELSASFSSQAEGMLLGVEAAADFSIAYQGSKTLTARQRALVATVVVRRNGKQVTQVPSIAAGHPSPQSAPQAFVDACGAEYVSQKIERARLTVVFTVDAQNEEQLTRLDQSFHGSLDGDFGVASISGDLAQSLSLLRQSVSSTESLSMDYEAEGYFGPVPSDPDKMLDFVLNFSAIVNRCSLVDQNNVRTLECDDGDHNVFFAEVPTSIEPFPSLNPRSFVEYANELRNERQALETLSQSLSARREGGPDDFLLTAPQYEYWPKMSETDWASAKAQIDALDTEGAARLAACGRKMDSCKRAQSNDIVDRMKAYRLDWGGRFLRSAMAQKPLCTGLWGSATACISNQSTHENLVPMVAIHPGQAVIVRLEGNLNVLMRHVNERRIITPMQAAEVLPGNEKIQLRLDAIGPVSPPQRITVGDGRSGLPLRSGGLPGSDAGWCVKWLPGSDDPRDLNLSLYMVPAGGQDPDTTGLGTFLGDWRPDGFRAEIWVVDAKLVDASPSWKRRCVGYPLTTATSS